MSCKESGRASVSGSGEGEDDKVLSRWKTGLASGGCVMPGITQCPSCGVELPSDAPNGFCPRCLFRLGFQEPAAPSVSTGQGALEGVPQLPARPRRFFGEYELLEEVGQGGMGVVFRARQRSLNRVVALKMLLFGTHAPPESVKRLRAEAVAAAALQHPNIVAIHEVGFCEEQHFIAMDFVEGRSLARVISEFGVGIPDFRRAASYVKKIAEAIHYAHEHGIIHRDLKPANVLIDSNDQPRVTDFGLAKRLEADSELTLTGQVLGSPNYMPPEQASGKRGAATRRSDVYALGAILYHALTGRPPFVGDSMADTFEQLLGAQPISPRVLNPKVPTDLETVCLKCLEKEPGKRYPTAQTLAQELDRFMEGQPVLARPVGPAGKAWRWGRRNPRLALAAGIALISLLVGLAAASWQWRRAKAQRGRAEAGELRARRNEYAADMKEVQRALQDNNLARARELLERHRPRTSTDMDLRGWEWRYLWSRSRGEDQGTLFQCSNAVSALAFSADGRWLAVRNGGAVDLWDAGGRRVVTRFPGAGGFRALAFSPRGNLLAWGNQDEAGRPVVSLQEVGTGREIAAFPHSSNVLSVAISPDAKLLAALAYDGTVRLWEMESRRLMTHLPGLGPAISRNQLSTMGRAITAALAEPTEDDGSGQPRRNRFSTSNVFSDHYGCLLFSPDAKILAVGALGESAPRVRLLEWGIGLEQAPLTFDPPADGISALAFSGDGKVLAVACGAQDHRIHVWNVKRRTATTLAGHKGWILDLAFSPDGGVLASASADQTIRLWDMTQHAERRCFQGNTNEVWALAWSPDGRQLLSGSKDGVVRSWNPFEAPPSPYTVLPEPVWFWGPAFLPDSRTLLAPRNLDGAVVRWDAVTAQVVERLSFLGTNHSSLALSRDGRWLALGNETGLVEMWDFHARRFVTNLAGPGSRVFALFFSAQDRFLCCAAVSSAGATVSRRWTVPGWSEAPLAGFDPQGLFEADLHPDERTLAVGYRNGTAAWLDLATRRRVASFRAHSANPVHVAFSPDGKLFAAAGADGWTTLWNVANQESIPVSGHHWNALHDLVFSSDAQRLVAAGTSPDGLIKLWDVATGRHLLSLPGEPGWYCRIGFSPDGNTLVAASFEGTALLWHAPAFSEIDALEKAILQFRR